MKMIIPVILDFFAKLLNISGIVDAVKNIINKIVGPIHKAIDKMVDWLKKLLNKVVDKVKGVFGKKEDAVQNDPEKQKKIDAGISDLRKEENKIEHNEKLTHEEAEQVAKTVKGRHPVFSKFYVVDGGDKWNYKYAASPEVEILGDKKAEGNESTKISYGNYHVIADPLTKDRNEGSKAGDIPGWAHAQLLNTKSDVWVKGHMLSEAFGGVGSLKNLAIMTKKINTGGMSNGPEQAAKDKTAKGEILKYEVKWSNYPKDGEIENFAKEVEVDIYEKKDANYTLYKNYRFKDLEQPASSVEGMVINLNNSGRVVIQKQFKISQQFARDLVAERDASGIRFKSLEDIERRMPRYYQETGIDRKSFDKEFDNLSQRIATSNQKLIIED